MKTEKIRLADVLPNPNNPRKDFAGIEELAASFGANVKAPGEPFIPPILVKDGSRYVIVDGERRIRAMRKLGVDEFTANVAEDMEEADTFAAMVATDSKQLLSELEKSRGVQQMLLLGVDPVRVEKAAGIKGAARIRKAMGKVGGKSETMSIEHLLAIEELSDDTAAMKTLTECPENQWRQEYGRICKMREARERYNALVNAISTAGGTIVDRVDSDYTYKRAVYVGDEVKDVEDSLFIVRNKLGSVYSEQWVKSVEEAPDPIQEAMKAQADVIMQVLEDINEETTKRGIIALAQDVAGETALAVDMMLAFRRDRFGYMSTNNDYYNDYLTEHDIHFNAPYQRGLGGFAGCIQWLKGKPRIPKSLANALAGVEDTYSTYAIPLAHDLLTRARMVKRQGFEPTEEEQDVLERLETSIGQLQEKAGKNG